MLIMVDFLVKREYWAFPTVAILESLLSLPCKGISSNYPMKLCFTKSRDMIDIPLTNHIHRKLYIHLRYFSSAGYERTSFHLPLPASSAINGYPPYWSRRHGQGEMFDPLLPALLPSLLPLYAYRRFSGTGLKYDHISKYISQVWFLNWLQHFEEGLKISSTWALISAFHAPEDVLLCLTVPILPVLLFLVSADHSGKN